MTDRLLVDLGADGRVSVSSWLDGELPSSVGESRELVWPLDADVLEELRWYLEDYLRAPFGVYEERGPRVAARLTAWGQAVFASLFGTGPARDAYVRMRSRTGAGVEIVFRSAAPGWLWLPWELLCDPDRPTPVALDRVAISGICDMLQQQPESPHQLWRLAVAYHQLGWVAQDRGLDDAQEWYFKSLTIKKELGNRPGMAVSFGQMGQLAEDRGQPEKAMEWVVRCVALFDEFPHPATGPGPTHLARLTAILGIDVLQRCWQRVTGQPLPHAIRDAIASGLSEDAT